MGEQCYYLCLVGMLVLLPSCAGSGLKRVIKSTDVSIDHVDTIDSICKEQSLKETALSSMRRNVVARDESDIITEIEARHADIPVLLNAKPLLHYFFQTKVADSCMAYETSLSLEEIEAFYHREMERSGWQKVAQLDAHEIIMMFAKPERYTIISLRNTHKAQKKMVVINQLRV